MFTVTLSKIIYKKIQLYYVSIRSLSCTYLCYLPLVTDLALHTSHKITIIVHTKPMSDSESIKTGTPVVI